MLQNYLQPGLVSLEALATLPGRYREVVSTAMYARFISKIKNIRYGFNSENNQSNLTAAYSPLLVQGLKWAAIFSHGSPLTAHFPNTRAKIVSIWRK